jgi:hypothetical protein
LVPLRATTTKNADGTTKLDQYDGTTAAERDWANANIGIVRMKPKNSYLEASPVQIVVDDPDLPDVDDHVLAALATARATKIRNARP